MTELNVPSYCADLAEFTNAFMERVDEEEGLLILYGSQALTVGERIVFQVYLDDGTVALGGEGNVLEVADGGEERDEEARYDLFLDQLALDAASEVMMERLLMHRGSFAEEDPDATGEVSLDDIEATGEVSLDEVEVMTAPAAEAAGELEQAIEGEPEAADAGFDPGVEAGFEAGLDTGVEAGDGEGFRVAVDTEAAESAEQDGGLDLESFEPSSEDVFDEASQVDPIQAHTVVEPSIVDDETDVPVESQEATGEVDLGELEEFEEGVMDVALEESAPAAAVGAEFFTPAPGGAGLFRPSNIVEWQAANVDLTTVPAGEQFAASAGLASPGQAPRPALDHAAKIAGLGGGYTPVLVRLTPAEPSEFGSTMPDAVQANDVEPPAHLDADFEVDVAAESDAGFNPDGEAAADLEDADDIDLGSIADDVESGEADLGGVEIEIGAGDDTQAVDLPPFDPGEDDDIDLDS